MAAQQLPIRFQEHLQVRAHHTKPFHAFSKSTLSLSYVKAGGRCVPVVNLFTNLCVSWEEFHVLWPVISSG